MKTDSNRGHNGDKMFSDSLYRVLAKYPPLPRKMELVLLKKAQVGNKRARDLLVLSNLRFVYKVAVKYLGQGLEFEDLLGAGVMGLMESIGKFDTRSSHKFITYAVWWIRNAIQKALFNTGRLVRISAEEERKLRKLWLTKSTMKPVINGWSLNTDDLSERLGLTKKKVDELLEIESNRTITVINKSPDKELQNIQTENADPETKMMKTEVKRQIHEMIDQLNREEQTVVKNYYGLDGCQPSSINEITQNIGMSRESVRQIKIRAMEKIKIMCHEKELDPNMLAGA